MAPTMLDDWHDLPDQGEADVNAPAEGVSDLPGMAAFEGEPIKPHDLLGKPFELLAVKRLPSRKAKEGYFYVAQCRSADTRALFTTTLGGPAVLKVVNAWLRNGAKRPLKATLQEAEGGEYGHYNVLL